LSIAEVIAALVCTNVPIALQRDAAGLMARNIMELFGKGDM
jgi:hypothetical protein